jgi:ABC-type uncharacterized transport system ATPase subunit
MAQDRNDVSIEITAAKSLAYTNGAGKTTMIKMIVACCVPPRSRQRCRL